MQRSKNMPIWVYLAFSSISTRKGALILIGFSVVFTIYCIPWARFFAKPDWVLTIFLIKDWSWFAMMAPVTIWYWLSLSWIDKNSGWSDDVHNKEDSNAG